MQLEGAEDVGLLSPHFDKEQSPKRPPGNSDIVWIIYQKGTKSKLKLRDV